jgi:hypothetical protein
MLNSQTIALAGRRNRGMSVESAFTYCSYVVGRIDPGAPKGGHMGNARLSGRIADYQACVEAFARNLRMPST